MKATLLIDSHEVDVDYSLLESIVNQLPTDDDQLLPVFATLAQSSSAAVRRAVASRPRLTPETVALLASDPSPEVLEALVYEHAKDIPEATLVNIIRRNWTNVNMAIACRIHDCDDVDVTALAKLLGASDDPAVRFTLAGNGSVPRAIRKRFLSDPDPYVRRCARESIRD